MVRVSLKDSVGITDRTYEGGDLVGVFYALGRFDTTADVNRVRA
jgi:hypothetical protein